MASSLVFSIRHGDGRREQLVVDADRALVGSGAHCEVRLAAEDAMTEHLLVSAKQAMVFGEARSLTPAPSLNGMPFTQGRLLPESHITIGRAELAIALSNAEVDHREKGRRGKPTTRAYLLLLLACALAVQVYTHRKQPELGLDMPESVPELWSAVAETCPQQVRPLAEARAGELRLDADGKRERSPFHPEDGVAAVALYRKSAACYTLAGRESEAADNRAAADALQRRVLDDFRLDRLRLERSLSTQDWGTAHRVIRSMLAFLQGRSGEYVNWLSNVNRRINVKFASEKGPNQLQ